MTSEVGWTIQDIAAILAIISIMIMWIVGLLTFGKNKRRDYMHNKYELPRLVRSFNINEIQCLQQNNIINSNSLNLNEILRLYYNRNTNQRILNSCPGSHRSIEEIDNLNKQIRSYKRVINTLIIISSIIIIISIYILSF